MRYPLATLVASLLLAAPLVASAQNVPSYAQPAYNGDAQIRGRIANFDGGFHLQVRDERGYLDNVQLHQGTIINPTGLTLEPGMVVSILGYNAGNAFDANEIDTPYQFTYGVPYYAGRPWSYYGPSVSLGFYFGNGGWWHGPAFGGPFGYYGGIRYYNTVRVNDIYRGGYYRGRAYVAPGGYRVREGGPTRRAEIRESEKGRGDDHGGRH